MTLPLPEHLSYSQLSSYGETPKSGCPRRYFLSRVRKAPGLPAWYFLTGSAIHTGIETFVKTGQKLSPVVLLNQEAGEALRAEPDLEKWLHGGSKDEPIVKDRALKLVEDCLESAYSFLDKLQLVTIETAVQAVLPGCTRPTVGVIDALGHHEDFGNVIVDWKSSSSKPKTNGQLETYRAINVVNNQYPDFDHGLFVMLRPGVRQPRPIDLSKIDPVEVGKKYAELEKKIEKRVWPAMSGFGCNFCEQKPNCSLMSGTNERTSYWDTASDDGVPY